MVTTMTRRHRLRPTSSRPLLFGQPRSRVLVIGIAVAAVLFLAGSVVFAQLRERDAETTTDIVVGERDATAEQAIDAATPVLELCDDPTPVGQALRDYPGDPCERARRVVTDPVPPVVPPRDGVDGADAPPPTSEQVQSAVAAELARNPPPPGRAPSPAEVAAAVAGFLTANPPQPGRPPTAAEIAAEVSTYFADNPPPPGEPGRPPTAQEIQDAVAAELAENPPPRGETGDSGAQGVGVREVRREVRDDQCVLVFVLFDPADGSVTEQAVPVPDAVCRERGPI